MDNALLKGFAFRTEHFFTAEIIREKLKKKEESEPDQYHYFVSIRILNPVSNETEKKNIRFADARQAQQALEDMIADMNVPSMAYPMPEEFEDEEDGDEADDPEESSDTDVEWEEN